MPKKATTRRVRVPTVKRVANLHGYMVVRHEGSDYALVPVDEIERIEDEEDVRDAKRAEDRIRRGVAKTRPFDEVCRELGIR